MAWFHFCTVNHNEIGRSSLVDMADWFEAGLLDLGRKVTFSDNKIEPNAVNVFWECFDKNSAAKITESGIVYGIIATEIPDGRAFNWRKEENWKSRFDAFHDVAERAAFIWTMVESTVPFYSKFCPTAYLEMGFSDRLIPSYINQAPEIDFCFFGIRTPYRESAVQKIRRYAKVEWPDDFMPSDGVGKLIAKSKIGLSFKQSEQWPIPSPTRLGRLMMAKRGVAAESVPIATRQGAIVGLCPESLDFAEYALSFLNSDWKRRAEEVFNRYRDEMPMSRIMHAVLAMTIADNPLVKHARKKRSLSFIRWPAKKKLWQFKIEPTILRF